MMLAEHGVLVTAPLPTTLLRLDGIVRQKGVWILHNLRDRAALTTPSFREFVSGETFHYLGRGYRLKVAKGGEDTTKVALRGGLLHVSIERVLAPSDRAASIRLALSHWYRRLAGQRLPQMVEGWANRLKVHPTAVMVREAPKRWGSCDAKGNIRLNWRIAQASPSLVEYVLAHELAHSVARTS